MAEEIVLKLSVDTVNSAASVKELKQVIRDATNEALKFKEGSAEFAKFANIAAQAKDKLGDVRTQMDALNPDARAQSFVKLGGAMVGGFTAATSAAALFGANAEDVQKALLKVQAAMGLLQGFQAIQDGVQAMSALKGAVMTVISSLGAMKAAIITTGIGALVVAIGILINTMETEAEATEKLNKLHDERIAKLKEEAEWAKFTSDVHAQSAKFQLDAAKARGESLEKLQVLERAYVQTQLDGFEELKKQQGSLSDSQILQRNALNDQLTLIDLNYQREIHDRDVKAGEDKLKTTQEQNAKLREEDQKNQTDEKLNLEAHLNAQGIVFDAILFKYIDFSKKAEVVLKKLEVSKENSLTRAINNEAKALKKEQELANARIQIELSVFSAISGIGNLVIKNAEKQAAFQKKLAAVQIIISEVQALAKSVNAASDLPFPANLVAIAASIASVVGIFVGIKSIFSKTGDVGGAPSLDTGSGFSGASASISSNTPSPSGVNFLDQPNTKLGGDGSSAPPPPTPIIIQNHISETEITKVQDKVTDIHRQATITD